MYVRMSRNEAVLAQNIGRIGNRLIDNYFSSNPDNRQPTEQNDKSQRTPSTVVVPAPDNLSPPGPHCQIQAITVCFSQSESAARPGLRFRQSVLSKVHSRPGPLAHRD